VEEKVARYTHSTDRKGRFFIPAKLRDSLGPVVYVTKSLDMGFLAVYTNEQFEQIRTQLNGLSGTDKVARKLRREIIGEAVRCPLDSQGRVSISEELWEAIQVRPGEEICLIDLGGSLEICALSHYEHLLESEPPITELDLDAYDIKGII
jgi:MraZ protein